MDSSLEAAIQLFSEQILNQEIVGKIQEALLCFPNQAVEEFVVRNVIEGKNVLNNLVLSKYIKLSIQNQQILIYKLFQYFQDEFKGDSTQQYLQFTQNSEKQKLLEVIALTYGINNYQTVAASLSGCQDKDEIIKALNVPYNQNVKVNSLLLSLLSFDCNPDLIFKDILLSGRTTNEQLAVTISILSCYLMNKLKKDEIKLIFKNNMKDLLQMLIAFNSIVEQTQNITTKLFLCQFHLQVSKFLTENQISNIHQNILQNVQKVLDLLINTKQIETKFKSEMQFLYESPILYHLLGYSDNNIPTEAGLIQDKFIKDQIYKIADLSFQVIDLNVDSILKQSQQSQNFKIFNFNKSQPTVTQVSLIKMILQSIFQIAVQLNQQINLSNFQQNIVQRLVATIELSIINHSETVFIIFQQQLESNYKIGTLKLLLLLSKQIKLQKYELDYQQIYSHLIKVYYQFQYQCLKLQKTESKTLISFKQKSSSYFLFDKEIKANSEMYMFALSVQLFQLYYDLDIKNEQILYDLSTTIIDINAKLYYSDTQTYFTQKITILLQQYPNSHQNFLKVLVNNLYYRQLYSQESQTNKLFSVLQEKLYYSCFYLINFINTTFKIENSTQFQILNDQNLDYIKWLSLVSQLLLYQNFEDSNLQIAAFRSYVLNYLVVLFTDDIEITSQHKLFFLIKNNDLLIKDLQTKFLTFSKLLLLFSNFEPNKLQQNAKMNILLPGVKWRKTSRLQELKLNYNQVNEDEQQEISNSIYQTVVEESEYDQKLITQTSSYNLNSSEKFHKTVFLFIYEVLNISTIDQGFKFYQISLQWQFVKLSQCQVLKSFSYRLSFLGLVQKLQSFTLDLDLSNSFKMLTDSQKATMIEFKQFILKSYEKQNDGITYSDTEFILELISAYSLNFSLLLLFEFKKDSSLSIKQQLQIFHILIKNASVDQLLKNYQDTENINKSTQNIFVPTISKIKIITEILVEVFQSYIDTKIYKHLILISSEIYQAIKLVLTLQDKIDKNYFVPQVMILIQYQLAYAGFFPINQQSKDENRFIVTDQKSLTFEQINSNNSFEQLSTYFQKPTYQVNFPEFLLPDYIQQIMIKHNLIHQSSQLVIKGKISQIFEIIIYSLDSFLDIVSNFQISNKIIIIMLKKIFSLFQLIVNTDNNLFFHSQIAPRILIFITRYFEINQQASTFEIILNMLLTYKNLGVDVAIKFSTVALEIVKSSKIYKFCLKNDAEPSIYQWSGDLNIIYNGSFFIIQNPVNLIQKCLIGGNFDLMQLIFQFDYLTCYMTRFKLTNEIYCLNSNLNQYLNYKNYNILQFVIEIIQEIIDFQVIEYLYKLINDIDFEDKQKLQFISILCKSQLQNQSCKYFKHFSLFLLQNSLELFLVIIYRIQKDKQNVILVDLVLQQLNKDEIENLQVLLIQHSIKQIQTIMTTIVSQIQNITLLDSIFLLIDKLEYKYYDLDLITLIMMHQIYLLQKQESSREISSILNKIQPNNLINSIDQVFEFVQQQKITYIQDDNILFLPQYLETNNLIMFFVRIDTCINQPTAENFIHLLSCVVDDTLSEQKTNIIIKQLSFIKLLTQVNQKNVQQVIQFINNHFNDQIINFIIENYIFLTINISDITEKIISTFDQGQFILSTLNLLYRLDSHTIIEQLKYKICLYLDLPITEDIFVKYYKQSSFEQSIKFAFKNETQHAITYLGQKQQNWSMTHSALKSISLIGGRSSIFRIVAVFKDLENDQKAQLVDLIKDIYQVIEELI